MKTLRFIGMALLTVLMSVAISSCSKSDDDNNGGGGSSASIEGTWIEKRFIYYQWDYYNNSPDRSRSYTLNGSETWIISKNGDNLKVKESFFEDGSLYEYEFILTHVKDNEYKIEDDRLIFSNITETSMQMNVYYDYYDDTSTSKGYEIWRFEK